jgi:hypothetical protein
MPIPEDLVDVVEERRSQFWTLVTAIAKKTPEYTVAHLMQYARQVNTARAARLDTRRGLECQRRLTMVEAKCRRRWWSLGVNVLSELPTYYLQEPNPTPDMPHHSESCPRDMNPTQRHRENLCFSSLIEFGDEKSMSEATTKEASERRGLVNGLDVRLGLVSDITQVCSILLP